MRAFESRSCTKPDPIIEAIDKPMFPSHDQGHREVRSGVVGTVMITILYKSVRFRNRQDAPFERAQVERRLHAAGALDCHAVGTREQ